MLRNIEIVRPSRQAGSAGPVIALVVIGVLVWWQWDWIAGLFGSKLGFGGAVAEVVDYRCDKSASGISIDGRVRNISDGPLELRAVTAIYDSLGKRSDYVESVVRPVPIKPQGVGDFRASGPVLPDGGACRLDHFVDSTTGKRVGHTGRVR